MLARRLASPAVLSRRFFATASLPRSEQITVPCRSNGSIKIDVFHGPSPSSPILIYLPSGPVLPDNKAEEDRVVSALAASSRSTIARVNYRFSPEQTWPTPLHDVLTGYDWIIENMLSEQSSVAKLGVCGELVGGSLATTLALTECRVGESRIAAAAVNNPIADWLFPDDLPAQDSGTLPEPSAPEETSFPADEDMMAQGTKKEDKEVKAILGGKRLGRPKGAPKRAPWVAHGDNSIVPTVTLSAERDVLFANPQHLLDRFASPLHFFRSPHGQFIDPRGEGIRASSPSEIPLDPQDFEILMAMNHYDSLGAPEASSPAPVLTRCRAYSRHFPPVTAFLALPQWHITSGSKSPLLGQATELAKVLKRSMVRSSLGKKGSKAKFADAEEKKSYESWAAERVCVAKPKGIGLWTLSDNKNWEDQVKDVGQWMKTALVKDSK